MNISSKKKATLLLSDGTYLEGNAFGYEGTSFGEVVFNTGMTGYQEVLTDPSYFGQLVTFTFPEIGNTGINISHSNIQDSSYETDVISIDADVTSYSGSIDAVQLNYDIGEGWETIEMDQVFSTNTYRAYLTSLKIDYYLLDTSQDLAK